MAEMHYSEYLNKVRGCIMGLGDMSWIEPALRVVAKSGADFTAMQLADAYEKGGALTPHFLRNMDRGIFPPLAVFDDPEQGGAGGIEAVFTALALRDQFAPPTIHYAQPDPECDLDYVPNAGRAQAMTYALSNSLGFGGHNACIALRRWEG